MKMLKKLSKRTLAVLCTLAMIAGCVLTYTGAIAEANSTSVANDKWNMFSSEDGANIVDSDGNVYKASTASVGEGVTLPEAAQNKDYLELYIKVWLKDETAVEVFKGTYVELANNACDKMELNWYLSGQTLVPGMNEISLKLSKATSYDGSGDGSGPFDVAQEIRFFRMYTSGSVTTTTDANAIKLYEVSIVNTNAEGLLFGLNDTHLQLENKLDAAPEAIEASVKADEAQSEWVLRSAQSTSWNYTYATSPTYHTVTDENAGPAYGSSYATAHMVAGNTFGFTSTFNIDISEQYTVADMALDFWFKADVIGDTVGVIDLTSSGTYSDQRLYWHVKNYVVDSVADEWYHVVLPLSSAGKYGTSAFDLQGVNYLRWHGDGKTITSETASYSITDIKLVVMAEENSATEWPLFATSTSSAGSQMTDAVAEYNANNIVTYGTVGEGENGPKTGTPYAEIAVTAGQAFGFQNSFQELQKQNMIPATGNYEQDDLAVKFWLWCEKADMLPTTYFSLSTYGWRSNNAAVWTLNNYVALNAGWNYVELRLDDCTSIKDGFDYKNILYAGFFPTEYKNDAGSWVGTELTEDCKFKITDIELVVRPDYDQEFDTLLSVGGTLDQAVTPVNKSWSLKYNQTVSNGYVTADEANEFTPAEGTKYTEIKVNMDDSTLEDGTALTGGTFGIRTPNNYVASGSFPIASQYDETQLAVGFWLYSETGEAMPSGATLRLSSAGWHDSAERRYTLANIASISQGWNYIEVPLVDDAAQERPGSKGNFDYTNINYVAIYWGKLSEANTFKMTDVKLVVLKETQESKTLANLRPAREVVNGRGDGWWYGATGNSTLLQTTTLMENGPEYGTTFMKLDVTAEKPYYSFDHDLVYRIPTQYTKEDLAVSFWLYSSFEGTMPSGRHLGFQSVESGVDSNELYWDWSQISLKEGWNYIQLNFADATQVGEVDLYNIWRMRWNGSAFTEAATLGISDMKLITLKEPYKVTTTEVTDTTTITLSDMIFSNINAEGETSPYALYLDTNGYPTLLWGTTAFTLNYDVRTGEWTDIKAVRNADKTVSFYINSELLATSAATDLLADDELTFATAHRIAADGAGSQVFGGRIANLKIYSDAEATTCVGNWALSGDIQDILVPMEDASESNNTAVYRGTRAEDWIDYDISKHDFLWKDADGDNVYDAGEEDYWSMVFIPDIQNLTEGTWTDTWLGMADWIANNIETEKIQHVIGAGDTTWSDSIFQYEIAMQGFNKFIDKVSWSNMAGNHDYVWNATYRDSTNYQTYFGEDVLKNSGSENTYVGYYKDPQGKSTTENSYYRFDVNGVKWMVLQLEYHPRTTVIDWAKEIIEQHPLDNVILTTHGYINGYGGYLGEGQSYINNTEAGDGAAYLDSTETIWTKLQDCTNIKYILCGHSTNGTGALAVKSQTNSNGEEVPAIMINAQDMDWGSGKGPGYYTNKSLGMLGILRFSADGSQVAIQYYSPQYEKTFNPISPVTGERDSNMTVSYETETCTPEVVPYTEGFVAGTAPTDAEEWKTKGYVFAGWFTTEACDVALTSANQASVTTAYAKYVDAEILSVKAQVSVPEEDGTRALRFITTVDSRQYKEIGFDLTIGEKTVTVGSKEIYKILYAIDETSKDAEPMEISPDVFSPQSEFFKTFVLEGFVDSEDATFNFATEVTATPYWITQDGTTVYGIAATKSINMGLGQ